MATAGSASEGISSPVETETLKIEEVQEPATGTRKAKVIYDYDAADSSELSLLADEVGWIVIVGHWPEISLGLPFSLKVNVLLPMWLSFPDW